MEKLNDEAIGKLLLERMEADGIFLKNYWASCVCHKKSKQAFSTTFGRLFVSVLFSATDGWLHRILTKFREKLKPP